MYRILLVEDDAALADAITKVLTAWGHEVQKVRDFRRVTEEFAEWKPQIVLMDLMLPFFNGHHWTQELRRITSVPIVYLSSASAGQYRLLHRVGTPNQNAAIGHAPAIAERGHAGEPRHAC